MPPVFELLENPMERHIGLFVFKSLMKKMKTDIRFFKKFAYYRAYSKRRIGVNVAKSALSDELHCSRVGGTDLLTQRSMGA